MSVKYYYTWSVIEEAIELLQHESFDNGEGERDNAICNCVAAFYEAQDEQRALQRYRNEAIARARDGEIEVDDNAIVSKPGVAGGEADGAYVQCWMWIPEEATSDPEGDDEQGDAMAGDDWRKDVAEQLRSLSARLDEQGVGADEADRMDALSNEIFQRIKDNG